MDTETIIAIRRAAFLEAIEIVKSSWTAHNNSTGHYKSAWEDAKKDIARMIEFHMNTDASRIAATAAAT